MTVRKATAADTDRILFIYSLAREYMKKSGNASQWGSIYPPDELVREDIAHENCHVICDGEKICGVFSFFRDGDSVYDTIDGAWLNDKPHGAIHRVASDGSAGGIVRTAAEYCRNITPQLKIDTHRDNSTMQKALERAGFVYCGTVICDDGTPRMAYQLDSDRRAD